MVVKNIIRHIIKGENLLKKAERLEKKCRKEGLLEAAKIRYRLKDFPAAYKNSMKALVKKIDEVKCKKPTNNDFSFLETALRYVINSYKRINGTRIKDYELFSLIKNLSEIYIRNERYKEGLQLILDYNISVNGREKKR